MNKNPSIYLLDKKNQILLTTRIVKPKSSRAGVIFSILFNGVISVIALIGVLGITLVWRDLIDFELLLTGEKTTAYITLVTSDVDGEIEFLSDIPLTFDAVTVSYTLRNRPVQATINVPDFVTLEYVVGDSVDVYYDPDNPRHAKPMFISTSLLILTGISSVFFVVTFWNVIRALRRGGNKGVVVIGEVLNSTNTFNTSGNQQSEIWYKFQSPRSEQDVFGDHVGKQLANLPSPGMRVAVMYYSDRNHKLL